MEIIAKNQKQYRANLHCHSTLSDGKLTPKELKEVYKKEGYSVLAITDHERPYDHSDMTDKDFLMLTGYEAYIRPSEFGIYDPYNREIHINLLAKEPHNLSYVNYDPKYDKYTKDEKISAAYNKVGTTGARKYCTEYVNDFVKSAKEAGYLCAYNHPAWSLENYDTIRSYEGFFSMEICNFGSFGMGLNEYNGTLYDRLLIDGKELFCHSADDNHNKYPIGHPSSDSFGGFTMILAKELTYPAVIDALQNGEFYSSMGPIIKELTINGKEVTVKTTEAKQITALFGGKKTLFLAGTKDNPVTEFSFAIPAGAKYLRINVRDFEGCYADTHAYKIEEICAE